MGKARYWLVLFTLMTITFFCHGGSEELKMLKIRQVSTQTSGHVSGGADSAANAAQAAGDTIDTGSGGARSTPQTPQQFAELLSGVFFGGILTIFFGGALAVQIWHYFERFGRHGSDRFILQLAVGALLFFSLFQDAVIIDRLYEIHVKKFGDFAFPLLTVGWQISASWVCIAINTGIVQIYYAHRVWLAFNKNIAIFIVYSIMIAFTFLGGFASAGLIIASGSAANVKGQALHSFQPNSIPWQFSVVFATWLCSLAATDVSLCFCLSYQLSKMSTPFFHTRYAVARLLLLSLETCLATCTLSLASMILFLSIPYQFHFQITFLPIGQVMASSLLVTLMARPSIARELAQDQLGLSLENNIDAASHAAPQSLAKPVVKRLMRNEYKKRPKGDGTGVHMTMTQSQMAVEPDGRRFEMEEDDESQFGEKRSNMFSSPVASGIRVPLQPTPFQTNEIRDPNNQQQTEKSGRRVNFKEMFLGDGHSGGGVASRMKTLVPNTSTDVGTSDSRYLGAVVASTPNVNIAKMANIGAPKGEKIVAMPKQDSQTDLMNASAPAGEVEVVQYGRTPLGRLVPMQSSNSLTPTGSHTPYSSEGISEEEYEEEGTVRPL